MDGMPPPAEFEVVFHKIKCGFNLVVSVQNHIFRPSSQFPVVHSLCNSKMFPLTGGAQRAD